MNRIGLVIGRFQPFHKGHAYLIKKALKISDRIIIGIGSSNKRDKENPFSLSMRRKMVEAFIRHEKLEDKIIKIISIPDIPDDDEWLKFIVQTARPHGFDVVIGNNEWVNGIFKKAGCKVITIPYFNRLKYEGLKIRKLMREGRRWEDRVPDYIQRLAGFSYFF